MKLPIALKMVGTVVIGVGQLFAGPVVITSLHNTGVANGQGMDQFYTLTSPAGTNYGSVPYVISNASSVIPATSIGTCTSWVPDQPGASWIAPVLHSNTFASAGCTGSPTPTIVAPGVYYYTTTFDLTGIGPGSVELSGQWAADGFGTNIVLNGNSLNLHTPKPTRGTIDGSYTEFTAFTIDNLVCPGCFRSTQNTLTFEVTNGEAESGLRVVISGTGLPVPEPATWLTVGTCLGMLGLWRRRR